MVVSCFQNFESERNSTAGHWFCDFLCIEDLLRAYGIKEIIRTGMIAMSRGSKVS